LPAEKEDNRALSKKTGEGEPNPTQLFFTFLVPRGWKRGTLTKRKAPNGLGAQTTAPRGRPPSQRSAGKALKLGKVNLKKEREKRREGRDRLSGAVGSNTCFAQVARKKGDASKKKKGKDKTGKPRKFKKQEGSRRTELHRHPTGLPFREK